MARIVVGKVHMRCTVEKCKKRFKGVLTTDTKCPTCGGRAKADVWAAKKEWRALTCYCNGVVYTPNDNFTGHRRGSIGCVHQGVGDEPPVEMPGNGLEYPF